ncbi:hypothetical protein F9Y90_00760 [Borrelia miyamotoi]|uniref:Uncharacterized protein n=1 Tax=Borrelia miyamotoi TaxID=47466 RepID=A0AAX3JMC6_9SPIR|nr:hypothetical protein [Borrelia miyamotoi]QFP41675.1 hypothetical protein F9Y90_00760 [Borrelia miyamotoi]QFP47795.1 hypothetical protein F9Y91_00755 [Borrelia miyamotoi]QGT55554.1 hypothetical protein GNY89_00765 [Borrelia miyamotoi]QGT56338.1 hypothetical protein GNY88_00765 [Borrelia miyamotoi]WAZ71585.1 hypothetical protein O5404_00765 [Borrelia miyamotoi]
MILKSLNNAQLSKVALDKNLPLSGQLEVVKSIGINKWLVSFLGTYFEVNSSLPLRAGLKYFARMINASDNFLISISYTSLFEDFDLFESSGRVMLRRSGNFVEQNTQELFNNIFDNIKDEFILKFLLALHEQRSIGNESFMQICDYFSGKVKMRKQDAKLPIFIENNDGFVISIPFRFLKSSGLLFLFSYKELKKIYKWSFVYFFNEKEKIICEISNSSSDSKLNIYSDFSLDSIISDLKNSLFCYNITDIKILTSMQDFENFDCEVRVVKNVNYKI